MVMAGLAQILSVETTKVRVRFVLLRGSLTSSFEIMVIFLANPIGNR